MILRDPELSKSPFSAKRIAEPRTPNVTSPHANRLTARMQRAILLGRTLGEES
jgi:hypothetical protein